MNDAIKTNRTAPKLTQRYLRSILRDLLKTREREALHRKVAALNELYARGQVDASVRITDAGRAALRGES